MGETLSKIRVQNLVPNGTVEIEALVDTGATYTTLPKKVLTPLGIQPAGEVKLLLADGRKITRQLGHVWIELVGIKRPNTIILGEETDATVIGLLSLEACGLTVDTVNRKLTPLPEIHHYRARGRIHLSR